MKKSQKVLLAAVLGSSLGLGSVALAADAPQPNRSQEQALSAEHKTPQLPEGFQMKDLKQGEDIRKQVIKSTAAAMDAGHFGKLIDHLAVYNRDRMKDWKDEDFKTLDGVINQINKDWQQKYGHEFEITKAKDLLDDQYVIVEAVVTDPAVAAANFPVPAEINSEGAQAAAHSESGQSREVESKDLKDSKNVALVRLAGQEGLPEVTASMIDEGMLGTWHFALPADTTAAKLHSQLQDNLSNFAQRFSQWPVDENKAYRMAAHSVVLGLYGISDKPNDQAAK